MCKKRFGSQEVILDGFKQQKKIKKNLIDAQDPPLPFMANTIKNFHFLGEPFPNLSFFIHKSCFCWSVPILSKTPDPPQHLN